MFRSPSTLVLLLLLALVPGLALAQNTGKLAGQVTDAATGDPLVGANVFLPEIQRGAAADIDGNFVILGIPVGTYTVRFTFAGYGEYVEENVEISSGRTRTLDAQLSNTELGTIVVEYERPIIQNDAIGVPKVVTGADIQNLPVRGVQSVAAIQSGVTSNDGSGNLYARGGREEEVTYYVDGVKVIGNSAVPQQAIAEQEMLIGTIPPQYGDVTGAVISVSTLSGGSKFFGSAEGITSEGLDGYGYNLGSLTLGGPIVPNFASFLLSGQYTYQADASPYAIETLQLNDATYDLLQQSPQVIRVDRAAAEAAGFTPANAFLTTEDLYYLPIPAGIEADLENGNISEAALATALGLPDVGLISNFSPIDAVSILSDPTLFTTQSGKTDPSENLTLNGNLELRPVSGVNLRFGGAYSDSKSTGYSYTRSFFNRNRYSKSDGTTARGYVSFRQVLSNTAFYQLQAEYTDTRSETYPEEFGNDIADVILYGDIDNAVNAVAARYLSFNSTTGEYSQRYSDGAFSPASPYATFSAPGTAVPATYSKGRSELLRFFGNAQTQVGVHELTFGGEYEQQTSRAFSVAGFSLSRSIADEDTDGDGTLDCEVPYDDDNNAATPGVCFSSYDQLPFDVLTPNVGYYGYDFRGLNEVNDQSISGYVNETNFDIAPYQPIYYGGYVRDRVEYRDLVIDLGLRLDVFDNNTQVLKDPFAFNTIYRASDVLGTVTDGVTGRTINGIGQLPTGIGGDYAVYVSGSDVIGFRDLDGNFYDATGQEVARNEVFGVGSPVAVGGNNSITEDAFTDYEPQLTVMPRIGVTFPVTNQALFFASYNVTAQRPSENAFTTIRNYELSNINGGTLSNPALKPEITTQYELGFRQRLGQRAAFTLSGFYRTQRNKITLRNNEITFPQGTTTYLNRDFTTTKGVEAAFELRRTRNLAVNANYTLSFAEGTGSDSRTARIIAWRSNTGVFPETISPLDFDQRHNVNLSVDYRLGEGEGPMLGGIHPLAGFGFNVLGVFKSGNPYTQLDAETQALPNASSFGGIVGAVNSVRAPSTTRIDLRVDRSFNLGPARLKGYLNVQNLLDSDQIVGVYRTTGLPNDDGFLATNPAQIVGLGTDAERDAYRFLYAQYVGGPVVQNSYRASGGQFYGLPRRIRLGVVLDF